MIHILFIFFFRLLLYSKMHCWIHPLLARQYIQVTHQCLMLKIIKSVPYSRFVPLTVQQVTREAHVSVHVCLINQKTAWEVLILVCIFMPDRVIWSIFLWRGIQWRVHTRLFMWECYTTGYKDIPSEVTRWNINQTTAEFIKYNCPPRPPKISFSVQIVAFTSSMAQIIGNKLSSKG